MITINLQWLALPCIMYALYMIITRVLFMIPDLWGPEIMPMLATGVIISGLFHTICALGLAWLIYMAFRP
jgi:hypothetical protein